MRKEIVMKFNKPDDTSFVNLCIVKGDWVLEWETWTDSGSQKLGKVEYPEAIKIYQDKLNEFLEDEFKEAQANLAEEEEDW